MEPRKMIRLGCAAYSRSIHPLKSPGRKITTIVGFDTEYVSSTRELISIQLWTRDKGAFIPWPRKKKLTPARLFQECIKLHGKIERNFTLVTYFSLAELQFLPVVTKGFAIREYANGSLDVSFSVRGKGSLDVFGLSRFFDRRSLAKAAESMGLEKLEYDTRHVTRACLRSPRFREYAIHDAYLGYELARRLRGQFLDSTGVDIFTAKTPASTSANAFRHLYVKRDYHCDINRVRYCALRAAWGGRAEVFKRGRLEGEHREYDLSSAYPRSGIALGEMPVQDSWKGVRSIPSMHACRGGVCEVEFSFNRGCRYPCLPVFADGCMTYPLTGRSWCTFEEVKRALQMNARVKIVEAWGYSHGTAALAEYLQWTLDERAKATGASAVMFKLLGNSIIGKFAQQLSKVPIEEYYKLAESKGYLLDDLFTLNSEELAALGAQTHVSVGSVFMPEWNALITGYTRAALAQMIDTGQAVYCHTDSAWTKKKPKCDLLPFDLKTCGKVTIVRTRLAAIGEKYTAKAVKAKETHLAHHSIWNLTAACQMISKFNGEDFVRKYPVSRPLKLRESIKKGETPGKWVTEFRAGNTSWDGKRELLPDGDTRPWKHVQNFLDWRKAHPRIKAGKERMITK